MCVTLLYRRTRFERTFQQLRESRGRFYEMFLLAHDDARYMDVAERALYNGFLAGVGLSGDRFFYVNPLESDGHGKFNAGTTSGTT